MPAWTGIGGSAEAERQDGTKVARGRGNESVNRTTTLGAVAALCWAFAAEAKLELLDEIVAIVDEDVVLESEVNERLAAFKAQAKAADQPIPDEETVREQIVERLIVESLQLQTGDRAGVRISDDELNEALSSVAAQNRMNLTQFRAAVESDGISWVEMRETVRRDLTINHVQQGIMRSRIKISDQEVQSFLASELGRLVTADEYRLSHILLAVQDEQDRAEVSRVSQEADALLQRLQSGEDFHKLAVAHSSGQKALEGGDLGWRRTAALPTMFSEVARSMAVGDLRGPIRSGSGFHIIRLADKRGAEAQGQVDQTEVRHVLIKSSEIRSPNEARDLALTLREEVVGGSRPFEEVAKLYSDDPGSALSGGSLGWSQQGAFVPEFESLVHTSDVGVVSEVFQTVHGYHFLEVTGRRVEDFSDEYKRRQAERFLLNQRFDEELDSWLREIREDAFVEMRGEEDEDTQET